MTRTIEVLQEDIDKAIEAYTQNKYAVCCMITQALNRTFKGEAFETAFECAVSPMRNLELSNEAKRITFMLGPEWKNVKPFTFTATEY